MLGKFMVSVLHQILVYGTTTQTHKTLVLV